MAACLVSVGQVIDTPLVLRDGRCGGSRGRELLWGVVREVEDHL